MTNLEHIECQIQELSPEEFAALRRWLEDFEADAWDRQIEADIRAGKLDALTAQALADDRAGKSRPL